MLNSLQIRSLVLSKNLIFIVFVLLLVGCVSKQEVALIDAYEKNINYHRYLLKTEKAQLYDDNNSTKILLIATYLNSAINQQNNTADEIFIVSVQSDNSFFNFKGKEYSLSLNGKQPKNIKILNRKNKLLQDISFTTEWSKNYLVTFKHVKSKQLTLAIESKKYGKSHLYFTKIAKYLFSKTKF